MAEKATSLKEFHKDMEIVAEWSTAVTHLRKLELEAEEVRKKIATLEKTHKFLGNLKGAIKKVSARSTSSEQAGDELPSEKDHPVVKPAATSLQKSGKRKSETVEKSGGSIEKKSKSGEKDNMEKQ